MALILNSTIFDSAILHKTLTQTNSIWLKLIHSDSTWGWWPSWILPSWILPSWIQPFCTKLWLKLIQSDSNSFILTQLDDGSHFEFCHLSFPSQTHSNWQRLVPTFCTKKTSTHSFRLNLMMAAILNSTMLDSDTAMLDSDTFLSSVRFIQKMLSLHSDSWLKLIQSDSKSFILTQLDDGSHLEFCHLGFSHFAQNSDSN